MVATDHINLLSIIPGQFKRVAGTGGGEFHGPCPMCGGTDRFIIQPDQGRWMCRQANGHQPHGDAIAFVMEYYRVSFVDACTHLGISLDQQQQPGVDLARIPAAPAAPSLPTTKKPPALVDPIWQDFAKRFVEWAWRNMHSGHYPQGLDYLASRGIDQITADVFMLGWCPDEYNMMWGDTRVYIPQGLVIPWLDEFEGIPRKINIRRMAPDGKRYMQIAGGANWLFNHWQIKPSRTVVLVEGEIDAISIHQGTRHHGIVAVATGSTMGARWMRWPSLLATVDQVLVCFDDDAPGLAAAGWWLDLLPNAKPLLPTRHDANEMLVAGDDMVSWIRGA